MAQSAFPSFIAWCLCFPFDTPCNLNQMHAWLQEKNEIFLVAAVSIAESKVFMEVEVGRGPTRFLDAQSRFKRRVIFMQM